MNKYVEFYYPKISSKEDFHRTIFKAVELGVDAVMIPFPALNLAEIIAPTNIRRVVSIDHPLGMSDPKSRLMAVQSAINSGANTIDLMGNIFFLRELRRTFNQDLKAVKKLCENNKVDLRVTIDYRDIDETIDFLEAWKVVADCGVEYGCPSNGFFVDDFADNIIMCSSIENRYNIRTICTGNIYLDKHYEMIRESAIYGIRVSNLNAVKSCV